jgi:hypothetical protein
MTERWMPVLFIVATSLHGWGQSQPRPRFALTVQQIAQTLSEKGIQTSDQQVTMLARVVATERNPALDVLSVELLDDRSAGQVAETRFRVKMACHLSGRCLPFYAVVRWPEGTAGHKGNSSSAVRIPGNLVLKQNAPFTIRSGAHATLVMDDERAHIKVTVVTLENGMAGQKIRVASPNHKQVYVAEVVSANLLKRSF